MYHMHKERLGTNMNVFDRFRIFAGKSNSTPPRRRLLPLGDLSPSLLAGKVDVPEAPPVILYLRSSRINGSANSSLDLPTGWAAGWHGKQQVQDACENGVQSPQSNGRDDVATMLSRVGSPAMAIFLHSKSPPPREHNASYQYYKVT
jgi:hypothetical protein